MNKEIISQICIKHFSELPKSADRCGVGIGNYVYIVECKNTKYVVRCSEETNAYANTKFLLRKLSVLDIPIPHIIASGMLLQYEYIILTFIEGKDIGLVYQNLSTSEKKKIAKDVVEIQNKVAKSDINNTDENWSWESFVKEILDRAKERILKNGYFAINKVEQLQEKMSDFAEYFANVKPIPYLDDISSKNLLINNGRVSGIIDIDWIGFGDCLTFVALTKMAFLDLGYDTDYITYLLEEMQISGIEKTVFDFYTLMFCVDFMGERGTIFLDKTVKVDEQIVKRLNQIYDMLWNDFAKTCYF